MKLINLFKVLLITNISVVSAYWKPKAGLKWNWTLGSNPNNIKIDKAAYDVIDVDLFVVTVDTVKKFHDAGKKVICYFSAGTYEKDRAESQGMKEVDGLIRSRMSDWDEYWLDFRVSGIKSFMIERFEMAKYKGCDGVELDNVDAFYVVDWDDKPTPAEQVKYNKWLAEEAHNHDLAAGLKNSVELIPDLVKYFDFAINEECNEYNECSAYKPFLDDNKAVFVALYGKISDSSFVKEVCSQTKDLNLSIIIKSTSEVLEYDYVDFDTAKYCGSSVAKTTTSSKKTSSSKKTTSSKKTSSSKKTTSSKKTSSSKKATSSKKTSSNKTKNVTSTSKTKSKTTKTIIKTTKIIKTVHVTKTSTKKSRIYQYIYPTSRARCIRIGNRFKCA